MDGSPCCMCVRGIMAAVFLLDEDQGAELGWRMAGEVRAEVDQSAVAGAEVLAWPVRAQGTGEVVLLEKEKVVARDIATGRTRALADSLDLDLGADDFVPYVASLVQVKKKQDVIHIDNLEELARCIESEPTFIEIDLWREWDSFKMARA